MMQSVKFYIEPEDILDVLTEEGKEIFNKCIIADVEKMYDGTVELTCLLFNSKEEIYKNECRYKLEFK